ncbi:MAG: 3-phosphoshikimate 1-carboxyvinyltransferase [Planctomycetaceae bacterium]
MSSSSSYRILPVNGPVSGEIQPPGSKSLTNRALIIAALATGQSHLTGVLASQDTEVMVDSLQRLGIAVEHDAANKTMTVSGCGGRISETNAKLYCENSGTSIRFLTALCATGNGRYELDGNARMRERPIGPLVESLSRAGVTASCILGNSCPPVLIKTKGLPGGDLEVGGNLSSQYLSALLMAAPAAREAVCLKVQGELVSRPYVDMTLEIMRQFGAHISEPETNTFQILNQTYTGRELAIEPDASAASYFFAAAAITGGCVTVTGLSRNALQGDIHFVEALEQMGCEVTWGDNFTTVQGRALRGIDIDMNAISDTAQTLACVAPFAEGPTRIRNVAHMRLKETNRVTAVVDELRRLGLQVEEFDDGMTILPGPMHPATIETYDDHRMAMSFALIGLRHAGVTISDPGCTRKTYPEYFDDLSKLCGTRVYESNA